MTKAHTARSTISQIRLLSNRIRTMRTGIKSDLTTTILVDPRGIIRSLTPMDLSTGDTPIAIHISSATPIRSTTVTGLLTTMVTVLATDTIHTDITTGIHM